MIIDELLDTIELNKKIDIEYIQEEAEQFEFTDILQAIEQKDTTALKTALKNYIIKNKYNNDILQDIEKIQIDYRTTADIMDEIQEKLFYTTTFNAIIWAILNDIEDKTINEFIELFEYQATDSTQADNIKWELLKNYTSPEELNKINYNDILQEFYNDIKTILEG